MRGLGKLRSLLAVVVAIGVIGVASAGRHMDRDSEDETEISSSCDDQLTEYQEEVKACLEAAEDLQTAKMCGEV